MFGLGTIDVHEDDGDYYLPTCPVCQHDVIEPMTDSYCVLHTHLSSSPQVDRPHRWDEEGQSINIRSLIFHKQHYPCEGRSIAGKKLERAWVVHNRCLELVGQLTPQRLHVLVHLVESTYPMQLNPVASKHGAFHCGDNVECWSNNKGRIKESPIRAPLSPERQIKRSLSAPNLMVRSRLPRELWDIVLSNDIGRLEFIMRASYEIANLRTSPKPLHMRRYNVEHFAYMGLRYDVEDIEFKRGFIRVNTTDIGGLTYVRNLSKHAPSKTIRNSQVHSIDGSNYLAVKTDGVGIVDLAFRPTSSGKPEWILSNDQFRSAQEVSIIRNANLKHLNLVLDVGKCRAIAPCNREGHEPYFFEQPFPPDHSLVDSSFSLGGLVSCWSDIYVRARYVPFYSLSQISYQQTDTSCRVITNVPFEETGLGPDALSVTFSTPPNRVKFLRCGDFSPRCDSTLFQFDVDGRWEPSIPDLGEVLEEVVVEDVLGIWWGEAFTYFPLQVGVVTSRKESLVSSSQLCYSCEEAIERRGS